MQQVKGKGSPQRRSVAGNARAARKRARASVAFLPAWAATPLACLLRVLGNGALLRRAALIGCFAFYSMTGLYAAVLNGAFDGASDFAAAKYRSLIGLTPLTIARIEIVGVKSGRRDEVLAALGAAPGQPMLWLDMKRARVRVEALGWVKAATVSRLLPDVVKVSIEERRPYAVWQRGSVLSVIDEEGRIISFASRADYAALPLVVGFGANVEARAFLTQVRRWPSLAARMRAGVRVADRRWNIRLLNDVDIRLPESGLAAAIDELAALDEAYGLLQRDIAAIDLRLGDRFTIRLSDEAATLRAAAIKARRKATGKKGADT